MRTMTTAAKLNVMIQRHIDSLTTGGYIWHSPVYLLPDGATGCNWNIKVNCNGDYSSCGPFISKYLDTMRDDYSIVPGDETATSADEAKQKFARRVSSRATLPVTESVAR